MSSYISPKNRKEVIKRAKQLCEYCLAPANYAFHPFCVDHIIPTIKGGTGDLNNLAFSCQNCNGSKHTKIEGIDPLTQSLVDLFHPRKDNWIEHFIWDETGTVIIGISSCGRATIATLKMNIQPVKNIRFALVGIGVHPPK